MNLVPYTVGESDVALAVFGIERRDGSPTFDTGWHGEVGECGMSNEMQNKEELSSDKKRETFDRVHVMKGWYYFATGVIKSCWLVYS